MLIVRSPMRISLGGGGTDLEAYYGSHGGMVVSTAINKYFYVMLAPDSTEELQVISADYHSWFYHAPPAELSWEGELGLPKAILHHFGITGGLNVFLASEIPPGTGLGSSSAAAVAIIYALATLLEQSLNKQQLAELASEIEISKLGMPIGKQDQYASAFGGLNTFVFSRTGVEVAPLQIQPEVKATLEKRLMLFFTGGSRESSSILKQQRKSTREQDPAVLSSLHTIKEIALHMKASLERGELSEFARLLDCSWQEKRRLVAGLSNSFIDECYEIACQQGAAGGKIAGAGGGGFLLLYCPEEAQQAVTAALEERGLKRLRFQFDEQGASIVLNTPVGALMSPSASGSTSQFQAFSTHLEWQRRNLTWNR